MTRVLLKSIAAAGVIFSLAFSAAGATGVTAATEAKQSPLAPYIHLAAESSCSIKCEKQAQLCRQSCGPQITCKTGCQGKATTCKSACK